jgi:hypothetical protein
MLRSLTLISCLLLGCSSEPPAPTAEEVANTPTISSKDEPSGALSTSGTATADFVTPKSK